MRSVRLGFIAVFLGFLLTGTAEAAWVRLSGGLPETDLRKVAVDPKEPHTVYAASERRLYKMENNGVRWKRIFGARKASEKIRAIRFLKDPKPLLILVTTEAVRISEDNGKNWKFLILRSAMGSFDILCLEPDLFVSGKYWIGTAQGLFVIEKETASPKKISDLPGEAVSGLTYEASNGLLFASSASGIYEGSDRGEKWRKVYSQIRREVSEDTNTLGQFDIEEMAPNNMIINTSIQRVSDTFYSASASGILQSLDRGNHWKEMDGQTFPSKNIYSLSGTSQALYVATDKGIFRWDIFSNSFKDLTEGLASKEVQDLYYDKNSDALFAATHEGIYRNTHPEIDLLPQISIAPVKEVIQADQILKAFENEPSIREVQEAAVRYAEVHPDKIQQWRKAAAKKAWLPNVSLHQSLNSNENIDLDRGGTGDPDRFIQGPNEKSWDCYATVSWDLGDLVWNDDQTSIDTRSKLMAELRGDILNEVTHLYFERRRLQAEMVMSPLKDTAISVEKRLRLEELTANIDALTGGFLSKS